MSVLFLLIRLPIKVPAMAGIVKKAYIMNSRGHRLWDVGLIDISYNAAHGKTSIDDNPNNRLFFCANILIVTPNKQSNITVGMNMTFLK